MASDPSARREAVVAVILVAVLGGIAVLSASPTVKHAEHPGSSYAPGSDGAKGVYLLLERLDHRVERRTTPLADLGAARIAFVVGRQVTLRDADLTGLMAWIERGGTLIYGAALSEPDGRRLRAMLGVDLHDQAWGEASKPLPPELAPAKTLFVDRSVMVSARSLDQGDKAGGTGNQKGDSLLIVPRGKGRVVVLGSAGIASNRALGLGDNALLFAVLAHRFAGDGGLIVFDEWSHGFQSEGAATLPIARAPARAAAVLFGLAFVLYGYGAGRRIGPPSPEPAPSRPAAIEQVGVLARFYRSRRVPLARGRLSRDG